MDLLITPECYDVFFLEFNFLDGACFRSTLSKFLGMVIIAASTIMKIPQIQKIYQNESGEGISILSITLDLVSYTIYMSYSFVKGFPFTQWGEVAFLVVQTVIIGMLILHYDGATVKAAAFAVVYSISCLICMGGFVPVELLWTLQGGNTFISLMSRLIQLCTNYKNGHTGQLSEITICMLLVGSLIRVFTSIQETGDPMAILANSVGATCNAILAIQIWCYWDVTKAKMI